MTKQAEVFDTILRELNVLSEKITLLSQRGHRPHSQVLNAKGRISHFNYEMDRLFDRYDDEMKDIEL